MHVYSTPMTPPPTTTSVFGSVGICITWSLRRMLVAVDRDGRRLGGPGPGRDHEGVALARELAARALDLDRVRIDEAGRSLQDRDAVAEQLRLRDVELVLDHLLDPERQVRHGDRVLHAVVDAVDALIQEARQVQHRLPHRLARDRAGVDAGAADDLALFDEGDPPADLGRLDGSPLAGRTGADHDEIETLHRRYSSAGDGAVSSGRRQAIGRGDRAGGAARRLLDGAGYSRVSRRYRR